MMTLIMSWLDIFLEILKKGVKIRFIFKPPNESSKRVSLRKYHTLWLNRAFVVGHPTMTPLC